MSESTENAGQGEVVVVTGAGGMGAAIARRLGGGRTVVVADASSSQLDALVDALRAEGHVAHGVLTDVSDRVAALAHAGGRRPLIPR